MGTTPARQHKNASVTSFHRFNVIMELLNSLGMHKMIPIFLRRPLHIVLAYAAPLKPWVARWRITEVINIMPRCPQLSDNIWIINIPPTACYIYLVFHDRKDTKNY